MNDRHHVERIGVLGGTFDPIHNGHLHVANALRLGLGLDYTIWVPAGRPPHKSGQIVSANPDRLAMLELALGDSTHDRINTMELERAGPSYTADTLTALHAQMQPAQLYFMMGEDALRDLPTWHEPARILQAAELAVAGRPGVDTNLERLYRVLPGLRGQVHIVPTNEISISSSLVRERVAAGLLVSDLVPPAVAGYISQHRLYWHACPKG